MQTRGRMALILLLLAIGGCTEVDPAVREPTPVASTPRADGVPSGYDPVVEDRPIDGQTARASLVPLRFPNESAQLNGLLYRAAGDGLHPTVVLLHGFPGNERNLDLAQAIRRAGFHVLFFHYRGAWGSEGDFSFGNSLEDVAAALAFLRRDETTEHFGVDPEHLTLVGHSMGGFLALTAGALDPAVACIASIAGIDLSVLGDLARASSQGADQVAAALEGGTGPLAGTSGASLRDELVTQPDAFDLPARAPALVGRSILLVAGRLDRVVPIEGHHEPMINALAAAGAEHVTEIVLDADHAFSGRRIALSRAVVDWLAAHCRR